MPNLSNRGEGGMNDHIRSSGVCLSTYLQLPENAAVSHHTVSKKCLTVNYGKPARLVLRLCTILPTVLVIQLIYMLILANTQVI